MSTRGDSWVTRLQYKADIHLIINEIKSLRKARIVLSSSLSLLDRVHGRLHVPFNGVACGEIDACQQRKQNKASNKSKRERLRVIIAPAFPTAHPG
jgi:hypothetical protein